jgi:hypothetical protein
MYGLKAVPTAGDVKGLINYRYRLFPSLGEKVISVLLFSVSSSSGTCGRVQGFLKVRALGLSFRYYIVLLNVVLFYFIAGVTFLGLEINL